MIGILRTENDIRAGIVEEQVRFGMRDRGISDMGRRLIGRAPLNAVKPQRPDVHCNAGKTKQEIVVVPKAAQSEACLEQWFDNTCRKTLMPLMPLS